jgi:hypothetical protein
MRPFFANTSSGRNRRRPFRLEALEDRLAPASWNYLGGYGGNPVSTGHDEFGRMVLAEVDSNHAVSVQVETGVNSGVFAAPQSLSGIGLDARVALDAQGRVQVFVLGTDNALYVKGQAGLVSWGNWQYLGGTALLQIEVGTNQDGRLEAFALGSDHAVWHKWQDYSGNWGGWSYLGGNAQSISVAQDAGKRLQVVALWADHSARVIGQVTQNGGWGGWSSLGGWQLQQLAVASDANGNLTMFALGGDHQVYLQQEAPSGTWGGWANLGGQVQSIAAGRDSLGRLEVVAVGMDSNVYAIRQNTAGGEWRAPGWGPWSASLGGTLVSNTVVLGNESSGALEVFAYYNVIDAFWWEYTRL